MIACFVMERMGVACETARLPQLAGEPIALTEKDLLCSVSSEAHAFGIRKGQALTFARSLCPGLIVLPYDREAYLTAAEGVWNAIAAETSFVEPVSPELVFADLTGPGTGARARALAGVIAHFASTDVRVGVGASKLVAEQAAHRKRDCNVTVVAAGKEAILLSSTPLASLSLLPERARARAEKLGIRTLGDVRKLPPSEVDRQFKETAYRLQKLAVGEDDDPVKPLWPPPPQSHAIRFDEEVSDIRFIDHALMLCASSIADALVRERRFSRILALTVEMSAGKRALQLEELAQPLRDPSALYRAALRLTQRMTLDAPITRLELTASELTNGSSVQLTLLSAEETLTPDQRRSLDASMAHVREKFGIRAILAARLIHKAQRIHLWTYRLGQVGNEAVDVVAGVGGAPERFYRTSLRGKPSLEYVVISIQNSWRESDWSWGKLSERSCFRVQTRPDGFFELHETEGKWSVRGVMD